MQQNLAERRQSALQTSVNGRLREVSGYSVEINGQVRERSSKSDQEFVETLTIFVMKEPCINAMMFVFVFATHEDGAIEQAIQFSDAQHPLLPCGKCRD
jgi:hypothetical protein